MLLMTTGTKTVQSRSWSGLQWHEARVKFNETFQRLTSNERHTGSVLVSRT